MRYVYKASYQQMRKQPVKDIIRVNTLEKKTIVIINAKYFTSEVNALEWLREESLNATNVADIENSYDVTTVRVW